MSKTCMIYVTHIRVAHSVNEPCCTYQWVMSHTWMTYSSVWHDSFICVTWLIHLCDMTPSSVWHDSFICVTWLLHLCDMTHSSVWHDSFICVTWLLHLCDMTPSSVWHDSFICMTFLVHLCDMTRSSVWNDSFICVTFLVHLCDMTHSSTSRLIHVWLILWMSHVAHIHESFMSRTRIVMLRVCYVNELIDVCDMSYNTHSSKILRISYISMRYHAYQWGVTHVMWINTLMYVTWVIIRIAIRYCA